MTEEQGRHLSQGFCRPQWPKWLPREKVGCFECGTLAPTQRTLQTLPPPPCLHLSTWTGNAEAHHDQLPPVFPPRGPWIWTNATLMSNIHLASLQKVCPTFLKSNTAPCWGQHTHTHTHKNVTALVCLGMPPWLLEKGTGQWRKVTSRIMKLSFQQDNIKKWWKHREAARLPANNCNSLQRTASLSCCLHSTEEQASTWISFSIFVVPPPPRICLNQINTLEQTEPAHVQCKAGEEDAANKSVQI